MEQMSSAGAVEDARRERERVSGRVERMGNRQTDERTQGDTGKGKAWAYKANTSSKSFQEFQGVPVSEHAHVQPTSSSRGKILWRKLTGFLFSSTS